MNITKERKNGSEEWRTKSNCYGVLKWENVMTLPCNLCDREPNQQDCGVELRLKLSDFDLRKIKMRFHSYVLITLN